MRIDTPGLRADGFKVELNHGYGKPWGDILLTKDGRTRLQWVDEDDCDQIIKAAAELKSQIIASRTQAAAPHGREHMFKGRCQLCGKPEDDEIHAPVITNSARDCDEQNPDGSGEHCHRGGDHGVHQDSNGDEWLTDPAELCDSTMPLPHVGELRCIADAGHYGAHTACDGKYRWLGTGADARTEEGDLIAPKAAPTGMQSPRPVVRVVGKQDGAGK